MSMMYWYLFKILLYTYSQVYHVVFNENLIKIVTAHYANKLTLISKRGNDDFEM